MKRTMARVTGIVAIVFASFGILGAIAIMSASAAISRAERFISTGPWGQGYWTTYTVGWVIAVLVITGLVILALCITQIVLSARLIAKTNDPNNTVESFNGLLIAVTVMSFFAGGWVPLILGIIALCMTNTEENTEAVAKIGTTPTTKSKTSEFDAAVTRLKQYKADGIIDDAMFKQKMDELFQKHYMSE